MDKYSEDAVVYLDNKLSEINNHQYLNKTKQDRYDCLLFSSVFLLLIFLLFTGNYYYPIELENEHCLIISKSLYYRETDYSVHLEILYNNQSYEINNFKHCNSKVSCLELIDFLPKINETVFCVYNQLSDKISLTHNYSGLIGSMLLFMLIIFPCCCFGFLASLYIKSKQEDLVYYTNLRNMFLNKAV